MDNKQWELFIKKLDWEPQTSEKEASGGESTGLGSLEIEGGLIHGGLRTHQWL